MDAIGFFLGSFGRSVSSWHCMNHGRCVMYAAVELLVTSHTARLVSNLARHTLQANMRLTATRHGPHVKRSIKTFITVKCRMGRDNMHVRPPTYRHDDPDGLSVRGLGSRAVPGGSMRCMQGTGRQKSGPIHELSGKSSKYRVSKSQKL